MTRNLPSVLNRMMTSPLKVSFDVYIEKILAPPVISIGEVNAARKPFMPGFAWIAWYWVITCSLTLASHSSGDMSVGRPNSGPRSCSGSSIEGRLLKNSTPAEKSLMERPVLGSSSIPPGIEPEMNTPSGPNSETANRMVKPPIPEKEKPPSTPTKKTRSSTGVVVSRGSIIWALASSLRIPPMRAALIWPPNKSPSIETPMEAISIIGNLPCLSNPMSMTTPSIVPENSSPLIPCRLVTEADRISWKLLGSV